MKQIVYIISVILLFTACNSSDKTKIEGEIANAEGKTIYLKKILVNGTSLLDSSKIDKSNRFKFKTESEFPAFYQISISEKTFITLLAKPGEKIKLELDNNNLNKYTVNGSIGSKKIQTLNKRLSKNKRKLDSITQIYKQNENNNNFSELKNELDTKYQAIVKTQRDSSIAFILNNLESFASIYALYQKITDKLYVLYKNRDIQYVKIVAESLEKTYPESAHVKAIIADKTKLINNYNQLVTNNKIKNYLDNNKDKLNNSSIPEIKLPNIYGDSISLNAQLDNTFILLNFWASWSNESIQNNIELLKLYKKYHKNGFEIFQVSLDTKKDKWEKSIKFDELPWINVSDLQGLSSITTSIYNVKKLPTTFLIRQGEIIGRDINIDQLDRKLSIALN
ncbi:MAG: TlpA disulfide reductase family protein [Bacteroidota bacterium]|nr:TlpA disulfide reductase family protein [Bacteroidota bacterium]